MYTFASNFQSYALVHQHVYINNLPSFPLHRYDV